MKSFINNGMSLNANLIVEYILSNVFNDFGTLFDYY